VVVYGTNFEVGPNYEIVSPIGQGAYGVVVAAKMRNLSDMHDIAEDPMEEENINGSCQAPEHSDGCED